MAEGEGHRRRHHNQNENEHVQDEDEANSQRTYQKNTPGLRQPGGDSRAGPTTKSVIEGEGNRRGHQDQNENEDVQDGYNEPSRIFPKHKLDDYDGKSGVSNHGTYKLVTNL